jgi:hypothetical protein
MSFFEVALNAAVHAMEGTRLGSRMLGHPIDALDQVHEGLRPIRAHQRQDLAQQYGQQIGTGQGAQSGGTDNDGAGVSDLQDSLPIGDGAPLSAGDSDGGGILDFLRDAFDWLRDL